MDKSYFLELLPRLMEAMGVTTQREVAQRLGLTSPAISDVKKFAEGEPRTRGNKKIPWDAILEWALRENVNPHWLLTGQGTMLAENNAPRVAEPRRNLGFSPAEDAPDTRHLTSARAQMMNLDGMPIPPDQLQLLMISDAMGSSFTGWLRAQIIRRPDSIPRLEAAIARWQTEYVQEIEREERASPVTEKGKAQSA